jgi:hypothetical protein
MESDAQKKNLTGAVSDKLPRQPIALAPALPLRLNSDNIRRTAGVRDSASSRSNSTSRASSSSTEETLATVNSRRSSSACSGYVSDGSDFTSSVRSGLPESLEETGMMAFFKRHLELEEKKMEIQQKEAEEKSKKEEEATALEYKLDALAWRRHQEQRQQEQSYFNTMHPFNMPMPQGPNYMQPYSNYAHEGPNRMHEGPNHMYPGPNHMHQGRDFRQPYSNYMHQGSNHTHQDLNPIQQGPNHTQPGPNHTQQGPNQQAHQGLNGTEETTGANSMQF